jgi:simple sugar transport system permease protein
VGVLLSGALAGLGGSALILTQDIQYSLTSVHGTGFIALACLIFGKWNPFGVLGAGLFFGFSLAASIYAKDIPLLAQVPQDFFFMLPYVLTVLALVVFSGKSVGPKAAGEIYDPGKR